MIDELAHIMVFKTNLNTPSDLLQIKALFSQMPGVDDWSVDLEDVDRVLRVVSHKLDHQRVIECLVKLGFHCCELNW